MNGANNNSASGTHRFTSNSTPTTSCVIPIIGIM